jgi:hypothetical protein
MVDPERATRFWLAIAVATLWVLSVGGEAMQIFQPVLLRLYLKTTSLLIAPGKHHSRVSCLVSVAAS